MSPKSESEQLLQPWVLWHVYGISWDDQFKNDDIMNGGKRNLSSYTNKSLRMITVLSSSSCEVYQDHTWIHTCATYYISDWERGWSKLRWLDILAHLAETATVASDWPLGHAWWSPEQCYNCIGGKSEGFWSTNVIYLIKNLVLKLPTVEWEIWGELAA